MPRGCEAGVEDLRLGSRNRGQLRVFLEETPNVDLDEGGSALLDALPAIASDRVELSLLTEVLHRKRPRLVPLLDRRLVYWYRLNPPHAVLQLGLNSPARWRSTSPAIEIRSNPPRAVVPLSTCGTQTS